VLHYDTLTYVTIDLFPSHPVLVQAGFFEPRAEHGIWDAKAPAEWGLKLGMDVQACSGSTWKAKAEGS
jgi:hypothetical protein